MDFESVILENLDDELMSLRFAEVKKQPKSNTWIKIKRHYYKFDTFTRWNNATRADYYDFAIIYPIDAVLRGDFSNDRVEELFEEYNIRKIFLITWTDTLPHELSTIHNNVDRVIVYDAQEDNPEYHERMKKAFSGSIFD